MEPYQQLEKEVAEWSGMPYVVACSSGTAALHLALEAMRNNGKYVVVPDFTMIACPRAVSLAGMSCVFLDCDSRLTMDTKLLDFDKLPNVAGHCFAVMAVHVYGRVCCMRSITEFASDWGTFVVEDLAEAHGVRPHPATDAACWSFYRNKIIAGEEGGAVGFREKKHADLARQLRSLGFTEEHDFEHVPRGCNYRLSNANAEGIRWKFDRLPVPELPRMGAEYGRVLDYLVIRRREAETWYDELCPDAFRMPPRDAPWIYDIRIPGMMPDRQTALVRALQAEGIAARHAFKPCSSQAEYRHCKVYGSGNAAVASREIVYLPLTPGQVTRASAEKAFEVVRKVVGHIPVGD